MDKRTFFLCILVISIGNSLRADFFAYRILTNPKKTKTIYLLYDIHASVVADVALDKTISANMEKLVEDGIVDTDKQKTFEARLERREQLFLDIDAAIKRWRDNLPHLVKQHNDLTELIKQQGASLIDEDWADPVETKMIFPLGAHAGKYWGYINKNAGHLKNDRYRDSVSPIFGIGRTLTGEFSRKKFVPIGSVYFYNADARGGGLIGDPTAAREVDKATLKAIQELFTKYKQTTLIIAEGFDHSMRICKELIQKGYQASPLFVSPDLEEKRSSNLKIQKFLQALEAHDDKTTNETIEDEELIFDLIFQPLDLQTIFTKKASSDDAISLLRDLQKDLVLLVNSQA